MALASKTAARATLSLSLANNPANTAANNAADNPADTTAEALTGAQWPTLSLNWTNAVEGAAPQAQHGPLWASAALPRGTALARWLSQACAGQPRLSGGALQLADRNHKLLRRLGFGDALLTRLELGALDARESRQPLRMALQWQAASWRDEAGNGQPVKLQATPRTALMASNYRLSGLPEANDLVQRVELPVLQWEPAPAPVGRRKPGPDLLSLGPLSLVLAERARGPLQAWRQAHLAQPGKPPAALQLEIALLDTSLKKRLAGISLAGCRLLQWQESAIDSNTDALSTLTLRLSVQSMALDLPAP